MKIIDLKGTWELYLDAEKTHTWSEEGALVPFDLTAESIHLPDSTSHAGIVCGLRPERVAENGCESGNDCEAGNGCECRERSAEHMTDRYAFEGNAWYSRMLEIEEGWTDQTVTLFLERTRISSVYVDGVLISTQNSLCGFHEHDLTGRLTAGSHRLTVCVNNTDYPTRGGHMTSPDTQSNWNGILGRIELQIRGRVYPHQLQITARSPRQVRIQAAVCGCDRGTAQITVRRKQTGELLTCETYGFAEHLLDVSVSLEGEDLLWDEYHPNLLEAQAEIAGETCTAVFGIRDLSHDGRRLLINGKEVFLRGKHDGLVFPRTGYAPMTKDAWCTVFSTAKSYGINHYRFHTCCPPEAAFAAADEMGMYLEPELPFWGTIAAPGEEGYREEEQSYLIEEGYRILRAFGNHPSFVIFSMGNELWGSMEQINGFLRAFKQADGRHLYTQGSNNFQFTPAVLEEEDVFCGVRFDRERLFRGSYAMCDAPQGHIQTEEPNSCHNYDAMIVPEGAGEVQTEDGYIEIQYGTGVKKVKAAGGAGVLVPQVPVISHEIGQYSFFPDFTELGRYEGSMQPLYLEVYRERMMKSGTYEQRNDFYQAVGALAVDCYRRELEAAFRTKELSGFQLLDLQDFPGQCVALVGVLNAWMESKGLITPEQWRMFCSDTVVLAQLDRFVVKAGETLQIPVQLSVCSWEQFLEEEEETEGNGAETACGETFLYGTAFLGETVIAQQQMTIRRGETRLADAGLMEVFVPMVEKPQKLTIAFQTEKKRIHTSYDCWVYPEYDVSVTQQEIRLEDKVLYLAHTQQEALAYQAEQKPVLLIPEKGEQDIEGTYCTDFWNYPMFRSISESMNRPVPVGTLGLWIDKDDDLLRGFPSECYTTPQWYHLVTHSHCAVLDGNEEVRTIVQPIDNVERCHKLGLLYVQGSLPVCTVRLWEIAEYPEVRAFAKSLIEAIV